MRLTTTRDDRGFTLVELLVAVVLLGIISLALGNAVIGFEKNSGATSDRMALSHDAQISAAYFAADVASVGMRDYTATGDPLVASIQLNAAYNAGGHPCGTAATPTALVRFLSDDWSTSGGAPAVSTDVVAYYLSGSALHRLRCAATSTSDSVVAHYVDPATVTVACSSTCDAAAVPQRVTLSFSVTRPSVGAYPITLTGQRRQT